MKMMAAVTAGAILFSISSPTMADDQLDELRQMLQTMQVEYEARIGALEARLATAEQSMRHAKRNAEQAREIAEETAIRASSVPAGKNAFNPAVGVVLVGQGADVDQHWDAIPGFRPADEIGPGGSGFSLGESELNLNANIDDLFFGNLTLALEDEDGETEVAVEEAWIQTTALPHGLSMRAGRHFSGIGYLNSFHRHTDDFIDRPLPYQALLGGQYIPDGAQLLWVPPTDLFIELGTEVSWGSRFPASSSGGTGPDAWSLFAHLSDDLGDSISWQAGASYLAADVEERTFGESGAALSGDSDLYVLDFVWKWAPAGNSTINNLKVQGEYFWRNEDGQFDGDEFDADQQGWYLQGVWQFAPQWRIGYRHDEVDSDNDSVFDGTLLEDPGRAPRRDSVMIDWSHSEFSRLRLQYVHDQVTSESDNQLFLQYIMSIGTHGAHRF